MQEDFRERQRKSYILMRVIYDVTMAIFIIAMGIVMFFGDKFGNDVIKNLILSLDSLMRYLFGGLCFLYGGFRLYRGIRHEY